jgi:protein-disulfide isomerase
MNSTKNETILLRLLVAVLALVTGALGWYVLRGEGLMAQSMASLTPVQVEALIAQYLKDHPDAVISAIEDAQAKAEKAKADQAQATLIDLKAKIFDNPNDPILGNVAGDLAIVEFFDYRCPYCKRVSPDIDALMTQDGKLKVILKEFPILGPESLYAAKLALAAARQGRYVEMHRALMSHRGDFTEDALMDLARAAGIDVVRLKSDVADPAIAGLVEANLDLGRNLGIGGTPAFIIGRKVVPGAISLDDMKKLVAEAREQPG